MIRINVTKFVITCNDYICEISSTCVEKNPGNCSVIASVERFGKKIV